MIPKRVGSLNYLFVTTRDFDYVLVGNKAGPILHWRMPRLFVYEAHVIIQLPTDDTKQTRILKDKRRAA